MKFSILFAALLTVAAGALTVRAQTFPDQTPSPAQDPPSRVARLNWINGSVSFQPAGVDTWVPATPNYPLTTGDHLYTDANGLAEMHIGPNAIRLNFQSNFGFLNLDDATVQMRFSEGIAEIRLRALDDRDVYEIDTPNGAITLLRTGDYRIETDPGRNATMITVRSGDVLVTAGGGSIPVHPGQTGFFAEGAGPDVRAANPADDFDRFIADRNMGEEQLPPPQHVPASMVGYQDLSAYGTWQQDPQYGWVWAPPVQAGWAPYHNGRWVWIEPWGWTWVDEAPWGFAPFHYGRWARAGGAWVWIPGARTVRPVYAPALVAFVGGPGFRAGIGIGGGIGAVTAVPQNAFAASRPVAQVATPVTAQQMASSRVLGASPQVVPQRESVLGGASAVRVAQPSGASMARQVVTRSAPPAAPVPFQAKLAALAQNHGRPLAPEQVSEIRRQQPTAARQATTPPPAASVPVPQTPVNRFDSRPPASSAARSAAPAPPAAPAPAAPQTPPSPVAAPRPAAPPGTPAVRPAPAAARPVAPSARPSQTPRKSSKKETEYKEEHH
jgi:hypothetical protein